MYDAGEPSRRPHVGMGVAVAQVVDPGRKSRGLNRALEGGQRRFEDVVQGVDDRRAAHDVHAKGPFAGVRLELQEAAQH